jgi:mono/diheme cytochrome c family protein
MTDFKGSAALSAALLILATASGRADEAAVKRGEYVFHAGGCESCHTDIKAKGPRLAGGPAIKTAFGKFYGPNITPHPERGIGKWTQAEFMRALRDGIGPGGAHYFPTFPYTSFTLMTDSDMKDLHAYLATVPPSDVASKPHEIGFPFSLRLLQAGWRQLYFTPGPLVPDKSQSEEWNRGAYLATALTHCGECHTPRTRLGGLDRERWMGGNPSGPDASSAPNITPDGETGIGKWSVDDIAQYLSSGLNPDGDVAGSLMADVVEHSTSKLSDADRKAIAVYIKSLKPIRNAAKSK